MSSRRQRSNPLGGPYRQVSLYWVCSCLLAKLDHWLNKFFSNLEKRDFTITNSTIVKLEFYEFYRIPHTAVGYSPKRKPPLLYDTIQSRFYCDVFVRHSVIDLCGLMWSIPPCYSGLLHWHWINCVISHSASVITLQAMGKFTGAPFPNKFNLGWLSDYIYNNVCVEITDPFRNFNGAIVEVWEWISNFIPHLTGHVTTYLYWD